MGDRRGLAVLLGMIFVFCSGFAPFDSGGLAMLSIDAPPAESSGPREVGGDVLEVDALFHTLSSRYGGGGVLTVVEFTPEQHGYSGLLLVDLRHAGLADLAPAQRLEVPNRRQVEVYYQEWDKNGDRFISEEASGYVTVTGLFRGEAQSALQLSWSLRFTTPGPGGVEVVREVVGEATTEPTIEEAIDAERGLAARRRQERYAPDGDIYVGCTGDAEVEEASYAEDSYGVDDEEEGCSGDTWEDDAEDPAEESGCEAKEPVDDGGEADPDSGCEGSGPDEEDPSDEEEDDLYYDESGESDDSGCEGDDDYDDIDDFDDDDSDEEEEAALRGAPVQRAGLGCGYAEAGGPWVGSQGARARLRRALDRPWRPRQVARARPSGRWSRAEWRSVKRGLWHLPFAALALGLQVMRRRL